MSEKFKLSVGGSKLKIEKIEERTDSIGRKIGLRSTKKDSQLIKQSISMKKVGNDPEFKKKQSILSKKRWKDPEYRKKQMEILQSEEYKDKQRKVQTRTKEEWIKKFKSVHGDRYDYSKSIYLNWNTKTEVVCKKCNKSFFQTPNSHQKGSGCPICGRVKNSIAQKKRWVGKKFTREQVIKKFKEMHGNKYDYSKSIYLNWKTKIEIVCKKCNISFFQNPNSHHQGSGCPICGRIKGLKNRRIKHGY